jgi:hypothetical protein
MPYIKVKCYECHGTGKSVSGYSCIFCYGQGYNQEYIPDIVEEGYSISSGSSNDLEICKVFFLILFFIPFGLAYIIWVHLDRIIAILFLIAFFTGYSKFIILFILSIIIIVFRSIQLLTHKIKILGNKRR